MKKHKKKILKRREKGITLIALVITIIVLLILAGVSVAMLTGQNGILTQANNAKIEQSHGAVRDSIRLLYNEYQVQINTSSTTKLASKETVKIKGKEEKALADTSMSFLDFLKGGNSQGINYVKEGTENILDVEKLTGSKQSLGNGSESTDVYKIEEDDSNYKVVYYGKNDEETTEVTTISKSETDSDNPYSYTQADIDETLKYFSPVTVEVTQKVKDELKNSYGIELGDDMLGKQIVELFLKEDYYETFEGYSLDIKRLVIPNNIDGVPVVPLVNKNHGDKDIRGPETMIYLNDYGYLTEVGTLKYIKFPTKTNKILDFSFRGCNSLENIIIPEEVTSIGNSAFSSCTSLNSITIPQGVTSIGDSAFSYCTSIEHFDVDKNNANYSDEDGVLMNKEKTTLIAYPLGKKTDSYKIPNSVISIGDGAFSECSSLSSITIPESVTSIGDSAFYGCASLSSITIPEGVTSIGNSAFSSCTSLNSITIPEGVTSIGDRAFRNCSSLSSITIPRSVTSIGEDAFEYCDNLKITVEAGSKLTEDDFYDTGISTSNVEFK